MKKLLSCSMVMAFLCFAGPQEAAAQGWGGFWNYMNKLSGPRVTGPGVHFYTGDIETPHGSGLVETQQAAAAGPRTLPFRIRFSGGIQKSISSDDVIDPDGSTIYLASFRPAIEFVLPKNFELGVGYSLHWFFGDVDTFWNSSIPVYAQWRKELGTSRLYLTPGFRLEFWSQWDASDFLPLVVDVERDSREVTWGVFLGIDIPFS